jgi:cytochrome c553
MTWNNRLSRLLPSCGPRTRALIIAAMMLAYSVHVAADDGKALAPAYMAMCQGCHGIAHYRTAYPEVYSVPKLGGQQAAYVVKALLDYKQGLRNHATMQSIAALQTDEQVAAIAAYYTEQDIGFGQPASGIGADPGAGRPKSAAACEGCHGPGGNKPASPDTPRLAAQEYDYLVQALTQYRKGSRQNPIMGAMAKPLDDAQIRELSRYFSYQRGLTEKY